MKKKYNLTFWQKFSLPWIYIYWVLADKKYRKSWHLVKKGMEKHKCNFVTPYKYKGYDFLMCDHEGCKTCVDIELQKKLNDHP